MGIKHSPADSPCLEETPKLNAVLRREKGCKFLPICTVDEWGGGARRVITPSTVSNGAAGCIVLAAQIYLSFFYISNLCFYEEQRM